MGEAYAGNPGLEHDLFERIVADVPAAIAYLDRELAFRWVNPAYLALYRVPETRVLGRRYHEAYPTSSGPLEGHLRDAASSGQRTVATGLPFTYECSDGPRVSYWDVSITPTADGLGVLLMTVDVTDRVERDQVQREQLALLRKADTFKDEVLGLVSHELRTPLHVLMGYGMLLSTGADPLTDRQRSHLAQMLETADHLSRIVNDILDIGQLNAGTLAILTKPFDLVALATEVAATLQPLAAQRQLTLALAPLPGAPQAFGDAARTRQVLTNLVSNGLKFTPAGGFVTIGVRADADGVRCEVVDTGPGVAEHDLPRLFVPFSQIDMSSTRPQKGTGLGLSISKGLVEAQGGRIGVTSQPGVGSTFWFVLPVTPLER